MASTDPATGPIDQYCTATPQSTTDIIQSGLPAATIGETVRLEQTIDFLPGTIYQDVLERPDGSIYFASYLELHTQSDLTSLGAADLFINGSPVTLLTGTQPDVTDFVLDTIPMPDGTTVWRVYFPGDMAAMLAAQPGTAFPSYEIPAGGATMTFGYSAVVPDDPTVVVGSILDGVSCFASLSSGPTNRDTDRPVATISVVEPLIELAKSTALTSQVANPGQVVHYDLTVTNPGTDPTGVFSASTAYDVILTDTLPPELTPVDSAGTPLADGGATSSGAVWNAAARTLTWNPAGDVAPGASLTVGYDVLISAETPADAELTNTVVADMSSMPDGTGRFYDDAADDTSTISIGAQNPLIDKTLTYYDPILDTEVTVDTQPSDFPLPTELDFTQTVEITLQPNSSYFNVTVSDLLPDGLTFQSFDAATCEVGTAGPGSCPAPAGQALTPAALPSGISPLTWYIGNVTTAADPWVYTFTYTVHISPQDANGQAPAPEELFTNTAELLWNNVDRFGGAVTPQPGALPEAYDGSLSDETTVEFDRPQLTITKTDLEDPEPVDLAAVGGPLLWQLTVTNVGGMASSNIVVTDALSSDLTFAGIDGAGATDGTVSVSGTSPLSFLIPGPLAPGASYTITYRTDVSATGVSTQLSSNLADVACYDDLWPTIGDCHDDVAPASDNVTYLYPDVGVTKQLATNDLQSQSDPFSTGYGGPIFFTITLENTGQGTAHQVDLEDIAPAGFCALAGSVYQADGVTPHPTISFDSTTSNTFNFTGISSLAPGELIEFHYAITPCGDLADAEFENDADVTWVDGLGGADLDGQDYFDNDDDDFETESPTLALEKTVVQDTIGHDFDLSDGEFEVVNWTITVSNTSTTQWAYSLDVDDPVPTGLLYDVGGTLGPGAATAVYTGTPTPAMGTAPYFVDWSTATNVNFDIPALGPGHSMTFTVPMYHGGTLAPANAAGDYIFLNTATLTSPNVEPTPDHTDSAEVEYLIPWLEPTLTKTVADADEPVDGSDDPDSSASGQPGEDSLEYTLTVTVPDNDPLDTYNVWVRDAVPHGIEVDPASITINCTGGGCPATTNHLGVIHTHADWSEDHGFWLGDVGAGGATFTITYNASLLEFFNDGSYVLGNGTYFYDHDGDPKTPDIEKLNPDGLANDADLWWNSPDIVGGADDDPAYDDETPFTDDGDPTTYPELHDADGSTGDDALYIVATPLLLLDKEAERYRPDRSDPYTPPINASPIGYGSAVQNTDLSDAFNNYQALNTNDTLWDAVDVGDWALYTVTIPNTGTSDAYDIEFEDDLTLDGALIVDPATITTTVAGVVAPGVCAHDDGGTPLNPGGANPPITPRISHAADDIIDCFLNGPLAPGDDIVLTYWAQTQHSSQLVPFSSAATHNPDRVENTANVTRYTATDGGTQAWDTGEDSVEYLVFSPHPEVSLSLSSNISGTGVCDAEGDTDPATGEIKYYVYYNNYFRFNGTWNIHPWPVDAAYWNSSYYDHYLSTNSTALASYYAEQEYVGGAYDPVVTFTMPAGMQYVPGSAEWDSTYPAGSYLALGDPTITTVGGQQVLTWDFTDPALAGVLRDVLHPLYYPYEHSTSSGMPTQETIRFDASIVTAGEQMWTAGDTAAVEFQVYDQLDETVRSQDVSTTYDYVETSTSGCGGRPGSSFVKSPDISHPSHRDDPRTLDSADEVEFFTLTLRSYSDLNDIYFVDALPAGLLYAGDPSNGDYLADPTTNIPISMWPTAAATSGDFLDTQSVDYTTAPGPTISWGPFDIPDSNGFNYWIKVPVRRVEPVAEPFWDVDVQNIGFIATGDPTTGFTQVGNLQDNGEMHLPGPPGLPAIDKNITNWEECNGFGNSAVMHCGVYGDVMEIELEVDLPRRLRADHLVVWDRYLSTSSTSELDFGPAQNIVLTCYEYQGGVRVAGCDGDDDGVDDVDPIALTTQPNTNGPAGGTGNDGAFGWYLGSFTEDPVDGNDRVLVITYELPSPDIGDVVNFDWSTYYNQFDYNYAYLHYDDGNDSIIRAAWNNFWNNYDFDNDTNWLDALTDPNIGTTAAGIGVETASEIYKVSYPRLNLTKTCEALAQPTSEAALDAWGEDAFVEVADGVANIACRLVVRNLSPAWDATSAVLTDDPALYSDFVYSGSAYNAVWTILAVTQGAAQLTNPINATLLPQPAPLTWEFDLAAGESITFEYEAHVDFFDEIDPDADRFRTTNRAQLESWNDDPDQFAGGTVTEPNEIDTSQWRWDDLWALVPDLNVTKIPLDLNNSFDFLNLNGTLNDPSLYDVLLRRCASSNGDVADCLEDLGAVGDWYDTEGPDVAELLPSTTQTWSVAFEVQDAEHMDEIVLTDSLPYGLTYVPGSAQVLPWDGSAPYSVVDPVVTAGTGTCDPSADHAGGGDTMSWTFTPGDADPFLSSLFLTNSDEIEAAGYAVPFDNSPSFGIAGIIIFDVAVADVDTMTACLDDLGEWEWHENQVTITGTSDQPGYENLDLSDEAFLDVPFKQDIELNKLPDDALEISGTTPEFLIEIINHSETRTYTALELVDQLAMTDAFNEAQAGDAYLQVVYSLIPSYLPTLTETIFTSSGSPDPLINATWTIDYLPPGTKVVLHIPVTTDPDTPTGTLWQNEATLDSPDMHAPLEEVGDITLSRPSPPPPVSKTGDIEGTVGSVELVTVTAVLEPGESWLDLALVDTIPDGLTFIEYIGFDCAVTGGPGTGADCLDSMVIEMTPTTNADGSTGIGWWMGDVGGDALDERTFTFVYKVQVADTYIDGTPIVDGDTFTNTVLAVSNDYPSWLAGSTDPVTDPGDILDSIDNGDYSFEPEVATHDYTVWEPDLRITKDVAIVSGETPLEAGDTLRYSVTVENVGNWPAYMVQVLDQPSPTVVIDNSTITTTITDPATGTASIYGPATLTNGWTADDPSIGWFITSIGAADAVDGSNRLTFTYDAVVDDAFVELGLTSVDNEAAITHYQNDASVYTEPGRSYTPPPEVETVLPVSGPDINVEKYVSDCLSENEEVKAGSRSSWCIVVTNNGVVPAYDVELFELLPAGWTYVPGSATVSVSPPTAGAASAATEPVVTPTAGEELLTWSLGDIEPATVVTITIDTDVDINAPRDVLNRSSVRSKARLETSPGVYELQSVPPGTPGFFDWDVAGKFLADAQMQIAKGVGEVYDPAAGIIETHVEPECATSVNGPGGCPITWYVIVSNPGSTSLTDLVITDALPANMIYQPGQATSAHPIVETSVAPLSGGQTEIIWELDYLGPGESAVIYLPVTVVSGLASGTSFLNHTEVASNEIADSVQNQAKVTITDVFAPPLLTKSVEPSERTIGEIFTYTITAHLPGPQAGGMYDVVLVDRLPAGLDYLDTVSMSCTAGCDATGPISEVPALVNGDGTTDLGWWIDDVPTIPDGGTTFTVTYRVRAGDEQVDAGPLTNAAKILASVTPQLDEPPTEPPFDPDPDDPWSHVSPPETVDVEVFAPVLVLDKDVSCDESAEPADGRDFCEVEPGQDLSFTVAVTNTGTWPAFDIVIVDNVPPELDDVVMDGDNPGVSTDTWTAEDPRVEWQLDGPLEPGESATIRYYATVVDDAVGPIINGAEVATYHGTSEADRAVDPTGEYPIYGRDGDTDDGAADDQIDENKLTLRTPAQPTPVPTDLDGPPPSTLAFSGGSSGLLVSFGLVLLGLGLAAWQLGRRLQTAVHRARPVALPDRAVRITLHDRDEPSP